MPADPTALSTPTGRFAPTPSGPLHFGSLIAALASFLSARARSGRWELRIDDLDRRRCREEAVPGILRTLEAFELHWDGEVTYQSRCTGRYREALDRLRRDGLIYPCACSRREVGGQRYPGTCRTGLPPGRHARALRVRVDSNPTRVDDALQGLLVRDLAAELGDFIVYRADGVHAYHLATVVDDAAQGVTEIVRGADLLESTLPQIHLQRCLDLPVPRYAHVPVATTAAGLKLGKQTGARALDPSRSAQTLAAALDFLGQPLPASLDGAPVRESLDWAVAHFSLEAIPRIRSREAVPGQA